MKKLAATITSVFAFLLPTLAFAQVNQATQASDIVTKALHLVNQLTVFVVAAAVLVFIIGVVRYIIAGNEEAKKNAVNIIVWGVVGLFAIVAVWGLVNFLANTTGIGGGVPTPQIPCPPGTFWTGTVCQ